MNGTRGVRAVMARVSVVVATVAAMIGAALVVAPAAHADGGGQTCFRRCIGQVGLWVRGDRDYIGSVGGFIQIVGPPTISNPRLHMRVFAGDRVVFERWHSFPDSVVGKSETSWQVGARFGAGRVCVSGYEGPNLLETACVQIVQ